MPNRGHDSFGALPSMPSIFTRETILARLQAERAAGRAIFSWKIVQLRDISSVSLPPKKVLGSM